MEYRETPYWVALFTLKYYTRVTFGWGSVAGVGKMGSRGHYGQFVVLLVLFCQVTSQDKAPSVISRVLKKNNRDSAVASEYELVQLLPGERGQRQTQEESGTHLWECFYIRVVVGGTTVCVLDTPSLNLQS